eukprot:CAMPEP_0114537368 /NCGR_PEP_ID=MMETSP0109-20121206/29543_1 /TAXON_ID=29199 /ORGANISM="Chlorarachnion reptans, Strain CCCM449" /LENGTH=282 /DNA_ID=CAMNT_0001721257 /DNA_START=92 /DNA_END=936 /DNA_ORIENTATION=-
MGPRPQESKPEGEGEAECQVVPHVVPALPASGRGSAQGRSDEALKQMDEFGVRMQPTLCAAFLLGIRFRARAYVHIHLVDCAVEMLMRDHGELDDKILDILFEIYAMAGYRERLKSLGRIMRRELSTDQYHWLLYATAIHRGGDNGSEVFDLIEEMRRRRVRIDDKTFQFATVQKIGSVIYKEPHTIQKDGKEIPLHYPYVSKVRAIVFGKNTKGMKAGSLHKILHSALTTMPASLPRAAVNQQSIVEEIVQIMNANGIAGDKRFLELLKSASLNGPLYPDS